MESKGKLNCKQATMLIVQKEESGIGVAARIRLFLHLLICKYCKRFVKQSRQISNLGSKLHSELDKHPHFHLDETRKSQLQEEIDRLNEEGKK